MQSILCKTNQKLIFVWKALFLLNLPRKRIELNVFYFYYFVVLGCFKFIQQIRNGNYQNEAFLVYNEKKKSGCQGFSDKEQLFSDS